MRELRGTVHPTLTMALALSIASFPACSPSSADPAGVLREAEALVARHRLAEALEHIERHAPLARPLPAGDGARRLRIRQARLLLSLGRPRDALRILESLGEAGAKDALLIRLRGRALLDAGDPARAAAAVETLPPAIFLEERLVYSEAFLESGNPREAATVAAAFLVDSPHEDRGYLLFGRALAELGREDLAGVFLERYRDGESARRDEREAARLEYDGDEARALLLRGEVRHRRGHWFEAMLLYNRAKVVHERQSGGKRRLGDAYLALARLSLDIGRPRDAVAALSTMPSETPVLVLLGKAYAAAGERDRALSSYREALAKARESVPDAAEAVRRLEEGMPPSGEAPSSFHAGEAAVLERMDGLPLSGSVPELVALTAALERRGALDHARALALFAAHLSPSSREARLRVAALFDRSADVFTRLWALRPLEDSKARARFEVEVAALGLAPEELSAALEGRPLRRGREGG